MRKTTRLITTLFIAAMAAGMASSAFAAQGQKKTDPNETNLRLDREGKLKGLKGGRLEGLRQDGLRAAGRR